MFQEWIFQFYGWLSDRLFDGIEFDIDLDEEDFQ